MTAANNDWCYVCDRLIEWWEAIERQATCRWVDKHNLLARTDCINLARTHLRSVGNHCDGGMIEDIANPPRPHPDALKAGFDFAVLVEADPKFREMVASMGWSCPVVPVHPNAQAPEVRAEAHAAAWSQRRDVALVVCLDPSEPWGLSVEPVETPKESRQRNAAADLLAV